MLRYKSAKALWRVALLKRLPGIVGTILFFAGTSVADDAERFAEMRQQMLREIRDDVTATQAYTGRRQLAQQVMDAIASVPRHEFVPANLREFSYQNRPLPIGQEQTISQPYIVALMTDLLETADSDRILEIGTGSGYQAAVLAELVERVYSIEIIETLGVRAKADLARLGYNNIELRIGDGYLGWPEQAPFDGIIVTAAAPHVPKPLLEQLAPGGRMVIPLKGDYAAEQLTLIKKDRQGNIESESILPVLFVPLTRK